MQEIIDKLKKLQGKKVILGLSGGVDSVVLFHLACLAELDFTPVHVNHELREAAMEDEIFCSELAIKNDKKIKVVRVNVREYAEKHKLSLEDAGRRVRRMVFMKFEPEVVLLAHHADDQVETILMNETRGATVHGRAGMREVAGVYVRPMLDIWKKDIIAYAKKNLLEWREDESNLDLSFARNQLRHEAIPKSVVHDPEFKEKLLALSKQARIESDEIVKEAMNWLSGREEGFLREDFLKLRENMQGEVLRVWWIYLHRSVQGFEAVRAREIRELIENNVGNKRVQFGKWWVKLNQGQVSLEKNE